MKKLFIIQGRLSSKKQEVLVNCEFPNNLKIYEDGDEEDYYICGNLESLNNNTNFEVITIYIRVPRNYKDSLVEPRYDGLEKQCLWDYHILNHDVKEAAQKLKKIIEKELNNE